MIEEIEINGYRLLNDFKADFNPLTVIIGANAVGKSSLIDCLQLIRLCCNYPLDNVFAQSSALEYVLTADGQTSALKWELTFHKPDNNQFSFFKHDPLVYQAILQSDMQGKIQPQYELLRNRDTQEKYEHPLKFLQATPYRRQLYDMAQRRLISFDDVDEAQTSSAGDIDRADPSSSTEAPQPAPQSSQAPMPERALLLSHMRFSNAYPEPYAARLLLSSMAFYPGFDVTRSSALRTRAAEIKPITILSANGDNLGGVLHEILTRYEYKGTAEDLRDFLRVAYPAFEDINCETTYGAPPQVLARLREKGASRSTELWELSDGMLRFLCLATALLNPVSPPLIAIDEPELGLHPGLLPIVADMIKAASERTQVLVTTHSPELLDCFELDDIAVMARMEDEMKTLWHRPAGKESLKRMLQQTMGPTLGELHRSGELEAGA